MSQPIVILGTGLAGYTLAREIRKRDTSTPLMLITRDDGVFYSKPMLSAALAQGKTARSLRNSEVEAMRAELSADILIHTSVSAIDVAQRQLICEGGQKLPYGALVLALGAEPIRLPLQGTGAAEVLSVNTLADYAHFEARLAQASRVVLLGAGLIGCEFANDLIKSGRQVSVFDPAPQVLGRLLPPKAAARLHESLSQAGVVFHLQDSVVSVDKVGPLYQVQSREARVLETDLVLSAVGLRSATRLAADAGLLVGRGIVVDAHLRTTDPNIYALGDCAEIFGQVLPYVMPIMNGARVLASVLTGEERALVYPPMPVLVKTTLCPVVICPPSGPGHWEETQSEGGVVSRHVDDHGKLTGFALVGEATRERAARLKELEA